MRTHIITQLHSIIIDSDKVESIVLSSNDSTIIRVKRDTDKYHITCFTNYRRVGNIIILDKLVHIEFIS